MATQTTPPQRGYRIRLTMFVPITKDLLTTKKAIEFAERFSKLPADAPEGTIIERFEAKSGQQKES